MSLDELMPPPAELRTGGYHFLTDEDWLASARKEASRLTDELGLGEDDVLLDFGCGAGRLAIGFAQNEVRPRRFVGVDVRRDAIEWCQTALTGRYPWMEFYSSDAYNERYRRDGTPDWQLPYLDGTFTYVYAYSVFSHMRWRDAMLYLAELSRVSSLNARGFLTAFTEPEVPDETINPEGYGPLTWSKPLHCVRFSQRAFRRYLDEAGWRTEESVHGTETDGQSAYRLTKVAAPFLLLAEPGDRRSVSGRLLALAHEARRGE